MATDNNLTTLNGLFKEVYSDKLEHLIPEGVKLYNMIKFAQKQKQPGNFYNQPVVLGLEHGITFAAEDEGAFTLNQPVTGQIKNAQVRGYQMLLRSVMAYDAAYASLGGGTKAFEDGTKFLVANMMKSIVRKVEISLFYGQSGYGVVASTLGNVISITTAEWAPGIFVGSENMSIDVYSTADVLRGSAKIVSVDMEARSITVDSLPAGTVATDIIHHAGAKDKEMPGLHKIITNASSLFGISAATYSLWKGNEYNAAGALTFPKVASALSAAVEKGLDSSVICFVNPRTWSDLMTDVTAGARSFDQSYKKEVKEQGQESLVFHSQNGKIEIHSSIFVKEGHAFLISPDDFQRIGSTDITFKQPGKSDEFFRELENSAGFEMRCYSNQSLFCKAPGKQVLIKGIVN